MKTKVIAIGALFCAWLMTAYVYPIHAGEAETSKTATLGIEGMT